MDQEEREVTKRLKQAYFTTEYCPVCGEQVKRSGVTKALYDLDFMGVDSARHLCNRRRSPKDSK